ncbi:MAG: pyridoxal-phosphate dependent enzyme [Planctomycetia bacterium]|nr:MAG: pyridoxal-phosphate dependent enzyme [Planctomycetia bacterium]
MTSLEPPREILAELPTPLRRLERCFGDAQVWIKRDDLTGLECSGNKIRKLEYILAKLRRDGLDTLVTEGTAHSNHCRAAAAACARLGLHCHLILRPPRGTGSPAAPRAGVTAGSGDTTRLPMSIDPPQGNHLLQRLFGATFEAHDASEYAARREEIISASLARLRSAGRRPGFTPTGASEPLGCWGYIRAAAELAEQLAASGIENCDLMTAVSSGGTAAGLLLGRRLHRLDHVRLHFVPVSDDAAYHRAALASLCHATCDAFQLPDRCRRDLHTEIHAGLIDDCIGEGYATPYPEAVALIGRLARSEGLILDPVYTSKAMVGLARGVEQRRLGVSRPVVFLHTGGAFSNFAWTEALRPALERPGAEGVKS